MTINIGEILVRAGQIFWKHKVLWIFGILAGCSAGTSYGNNVNYSFSNGDTANLPPAISNAANQAAQNPALIVGAITLAVALICIFILVFIALGVVGRIGLITGTQKADADVERLTFRELVETGKPYFWRVFWLQILLGLAAFVLVLIFGAALLVFAVATLGFGILCLIPLFCLLVPIAWLVTVIIEQATVAMVVEDLGIIEGMRRGWQVVSSDWGAVIVMTLILFIGLAVVSLVLGLPFLLITFPAMIAFVTGGPTVQQTVLILGLACACLYVPILIFANGLLQTYYHSAWTLTFLRLTGRGPEPAKPKDSLAPRQLEPLDA
jgi:hypothetical protein